MSGFIDKVEPCAIVIVGAGGDLGKLKLMPALARLEEQGLLPDDYRVLATTRHEVDHQDFTTRLLSQVDCPADTRERFAARLLVVGGFDPASATATPSPLQATLADLPYRQRLFYAATPPGQFAHIAATLNREGLLTASSPLVLEKPLGHGLASYEEINRAVSAHVPEHLIYRIDHYLGKETVQNILCLRFANLIFESLWDRNHIDHVQITVAETVGCAGRAGYYDHAGAMRDMVQNHLVQLLCLVAMEQPRAYDADCVRDEKLKVIQSLAPVGKGDIVLGQYARGLVDGEKVAGYPEDVDHPGSGTETFAALRVGIDNWRWAGVPFFLRTGKRLPKRESRIMIRFRQIPHSLFGATEELNQVVIRLQPDEGVELQVNNKIPGPGGLRLEPKHLNLNLNPAAGNRLPDAYERLLLDALRGNATLYMRDDEVRASWQWIEPALAAMRPAVDKYAAGTWGPDNAQLLLAASGRRWANPVHEH